MFVCGLAQRTLVVLALMISFLLAACAEEAAPEPTPTTVAKEPMVVRVVTTTNFVADWATIVGGDRVEVFSLLPPGADPHSFQPGARDVARIADADLVLSVGIGLETGWLTELIKNANTDEAKLVALGELVDPIEFVDIGVGHGEEGDHEEEEGDHGEEEGESEEEEGHHDEEEGDAEEEEGHHGEEEGDAEEEEGHHDEEEGDAEEEEGHHDEEEGDAEEEEGHHEEEEGDHEEEGEHHDEGGHGLYDPHFWFDPLRVKIVVNEIASRLAAVDPEGGDLYRENAASYVTELDELHAWTKEQVDVIPPDRRLLLTSHDSLAYFAQLYGFKVVGAIIPTSLSTEVEPTAAHLGNLVEVIAHNDVQAVFGETTVSERIAKAISNETGAKLVRLYTGSLGPEGSGADTYLGMQRTNVEKIVEALK